MSIKLIIGIISAGIIIVGGVPYLKSIYKQQTSPYILCWLGRAFILALGTLAIFSRDGFSWVTPILLANLLLSICIVVYTLVKKVAVWSTDQSDKIGFFIGFLGVYLWWQTNAPLLAIISAIGALSFIKPYKDLKPNQILSMQIPVIIAAILSLFTVKHFSYIEVWYPLFLLIADIGYELITAMIPKEFKGNQTR